MLTCTLVSLQGLDPHKHISGGADEGENYAQFIKQYSPVFTGVFTLISTLNAIKQLFYLQKKRSTYQRGLYIGMRSLFLDVEHLGTLCSMWTQRGLPWRSSDRHNINAAYEYQT